MERDDSRQPSHFMKCRLCQPNLFSGIFALFGASADGRGISLLIIYSVVRTYYNINEKEKTLPDWQGVWKAVCGPLKIANKGKIFCLRNLR
jgi:hypothetical protein